MGDRVEVGPLAGFEFGVDKFTVDANFEGTAAGPDQLGIHAGRFTNESRQPGSFRFVVSDPAIFDRDLGFHARLLIASKLSGQRYAVEAEVNDLGYNKTKRRGLCANFIAARPPR